MVQQSLGEHPADAVPAHCRLDVETPHPQRSRHGMFDGHASDTGQRLTGVSGEQLFANIVKPDFAS
ncbi:hypothetical protein ATY76_15985 [Rhizobium sp. R339]|nr:hypothetical protein ATY76_15985 [Rhizobium sp. R339]